MWTETSQLDTAVSGAAGVNLGGTIYLLGGEENDMDFFTKPSRLIQCFDTGRAEVPDQALHAAVRRVHARRGPHGRDLRGGRGGLPGVLQPPAGELHAPALPRGLELRAVAVEGGQLQRLHLRLQGQVQERGCQHVEVQPGHVCGFRNQGDQNPPHKLAVCTGLKK